MEAYRELVRWSVVVGCGALAYLAWSCPCRTVFGCHKHVAAVISIILTALTFASAFPSAAAGSKPVAFPSASMAGSVGSKPVAYAL